MKADTWFGGVMVGHWTFDWKVMCSNADQVIIKWIL